LLTNLIINSLFIAAANVLDAAAVFYKMKKGMIFLNIILYILSLSELSLLFVNEHVFVSFQRVSKTLIWVTPKGTLDVDVV
jgi:hypothetical protein